MAGAGKVGMVAGGWCGIGSDNWRSEIRMLSCWAKFLMVQSRASESSGALRKSRLESVETFGF